MNDGFEKNIELNLATGSERDKLQFADLIEMSRDRIVSLNLQQAAGDKAATNLAATVILQRKARILDSIANGRATLQEHLRPEDEKLLDDLEAATDKLARAALRGPGKTPVAEYAKQLTTLQQDREKVEGEISRRTAGFYEASGPISLSEIQAAVPANAALIEFALYRPFYPKARDIVKEEYGAPRYAAYVIPRNGEIYAKDLGDAKEINKTIDALLQSLRDPQRSDAKTAACGCIRKNPRANCGCHSGAHRI